jgi:antitoxin component of MazEF toxin-antitoxin module
MQFKAIKRGKNLEFSEELNIPDGQEIIVDIQDSQLITPEERQQKLKDFLENDWDDEAREDFIKTMQELEKEKNEQWEKLYGHLQG